MVIKKNIKRFAVVLSMISFGLFIVFSLNAVPETHAVLPSELPIFSTPYTGGLNSRDAYQMQERNSSDDEIYFTNLACLSAQEAGRRVHHDSIDAIARSKEWSDRCLVIQKAGYGGGIRKLRRFIHR